MINSFWNICRACPLPIEKFRSEYRSTFQWHPKLEIQASSAFQQVPVVRQPAQNQLHSSSLAGPCEQVIPRRKKHPDLAYRTNEWFGNCSSTPPKLQPATKTTREMTAIGESVNIKPKKSISMGTIPVHAPTHQKQKSKLQSNEGGIDFSEIPETQEFSSLKAMPELIEEKSQNDQKQESVTHRKEYKTEYKNRFRPFSQYEYVDGKFLKKDKDHLESTQSPWYAEVIELRKKAGEYKFRGWGTDLGSSNTSDIIFNQQLWEQVSRRSSLAPLALITTTPRYTPKEEKEKRNAKKRLSGKEGQPRPHTATPRHATTDLEGYKSSKENEAVQPRKKKPDSASKKAALRVKARSQSAGPINRSSPQKGTPRQPSTASSASEKDSVGAGWKVPVEDSKPKQRYIRPTTLATSPRSRASSGKGDLDANSKLANQHRIDKSSADPSLGYSDSSVVKSPVEPTRVKSPDQAGVKSPDGVKWTVPLDTTKGFIVTQNIREGGISDDPSSTNVEQSVPQTKLVKIAINGNEDRPTRKFGPIFSNKSKALPPPALKKPDETLKHSIVSDAGKTKEASDDSAKGKKVPSGKPTVRCLDDPTFMFESSPPSSGTGKPLKKIPEKAQPAKGSIRVLEAPITTTKPKAKDSKEPVAQNSGAAAVSDSQTKESKVSTYRVLEAPDKSVEKTGSSSKASDVLKKARHRFDKFWSKSKEEE